MKKFILKTVYFNLLLLPLIYIKPLLLLSKDDYQDIVKGAEVYHSINKSKQKSDSKILIIGDSVGNQLFSNHEAKDSINSLACNQAIGVIGQYLILQNYLETGNKPNVVYLLYTPFSFSNNLNQIHTFHYFLKPFYKAEYKNDFSSKVFEQIDKIPFAKLSQEPFILTSNWSPDFSPSDEKNYTFLSPISISYLGKMKSLCYSKGIEFHTIPTPTKKTRKTKVNQFNPNEYIGIEIENEMKFYLNNIIYLEDNAFKDHVHLKKAEKYKEDILQLLKRARTHKG